MPIDRERVNAGNSGATWIALAYDGMAKYPYRSLIKIVIFKLIDL